MSGDLSGNLTVQGDIITLKLNNLSLNAKIPRGNQGAPGRDGVNIKGDKGDQGVPGDTGRDGRDSVVPGPIGPQGPQGPQGNMPVLRMGNIVTGEMASANISKESDDSYLLNLVVPRGLKGENGLPGRDGKNGNHEVVTYNSFGNNPRFDIEMLSCHFLADGDFTVPDMNESDMGKWFCVKTLSCLAVMNLVEEKVVLNKNESGKFVVVPYQGRFVFTRF
jgi:hypothetical protein